MLSEVQRSMEKINKGDKQGVINLLSRFVKYDDYIYSKSSLNIDGMVIVDIKCYDNIIEIQLSNVVRNYKHLIRIRLK